MPINLQLPPDLLPLNSRANLKYWGLGAIIWFVISGGAILKAWPQGTPTQGLFFWFILIGSPLFLFLLFMAARYFVYQIDVQYIQEYNEQKNIEKLKRIRRGKTPVWLLSSAYVSALGSKDLMSESLADHSAIHAAPTSGIARFAALEMPLLISPVFDLDLDLDDVVTPNKQDLTTLLTGLISQIAEPFALFPLSTVVHVQFSLSPELSHEQLAELWLAISTSLPKLNYTLNQGQGFASLDAFFEQQASTTLLLTIAATLHPSPVENAGEAACVLLFAHPAFCQQWQCAPQALVHRPQPILLDQSEALNTTLVWGQTPAAELGVVLSGLNRPAKLSAISLLDTAKLKNKPADLDLAIGELGPCGAWLSLAACAETQAAQLLISQDQQEYWTVVRPAIQSKDVVA